MSVDLSWLDRNFPERDPLEHCVHCDGALRKVWVGSKGWVHTLTGATYCKPDLGIGTRAHPKEVST